MPLELPKCTDDTAAAASADSSGAQTILNSDLEAATILCGGGRIDLVYRVRPRKLLKGLGNRGALAMIHAEGVAQTDDVNPAFQPPGQHGRQQRKHWYGCTDANAQPIAARHTLDLQAAVGHLLPLRTADGKKRKDGPMPSPGLADTVFQVLGFKMDKAMQCSSWSDRPLSEAQLYYAAKDAIVLHSLYERIASRESEHACTITTYAC